MMTSHETGRSVRDVPTKSHSGSRQEYGVALGAAPRRPKEDDRPLVQITVHGALRELPAAAVSFLAEHRGDALCLSDTWFDLLLHYCSAADQQPRIYVATDANGRVDGILFTVSSRCAPRYRPRKLRSLTSFYTISFAPILRQDIGDAAAVMDALAAAIVRENPAWDVVELRGLIAEAAATPQLVQAFRRAGMLVGTYRQFENWYHPTAGLSGEEYLRRRPSRLRNTISRKSKKIKEGRSVDFRLYDSVDALPKAVEDYQRVYASSWKTPEAYPDFIPQLMRRYAELGELRLGILYLDGAPAAAQIWLVTGKRATIYKLAYDERYAPLSAGSILTKMMFDRVLDVDRVVEVDYGIGGETYKLDWMTECRHVVALIAFNRFSIKGLLSAGWHFAGQFKSRIFHGIGRRGRGGHGGESALSDRVGAANAAESSVLGIK